MRPHRVGQHCDPEPEGATLSLQDIWPDVHREHRHAVHRLRQIVDLVTIVLTLLTHGYPLQAIVAVFGLDERTVAAWFQRAVQHTQHLDQQLVQQGQSDLQHVQADELWVKLVDRHVWQAMAIAVPPCLWLGGVISAQRDGQLISAFVAQVRASAVTLAILVCVDWLASM
jgi:transposase-like protein